MLHDPSQFPQGFRPSTLGLEHLSWVAELPVSELVLILRGDGALCEQILNQSYNKRYTPSTFIEEKDGGFRVGWYRGGYIAVRSFSDRAQAVADYLLFSFGIGRLDDDAVHT
jgi:hypothetical protein